MYPEVLVPRVISSPATVKSPPITVSPVVHTVGVTIQVAKLATPSTSNKCDGVAVPIPTRSVEVSR